MTVASRLPKNAFAFSLTLDNAYWVKYQCSIPAGYLTAPDGTLSAQKVMETNANDNHVIYKTMALDQGQIYTMHVMAKADSRNWLQIYLNGTAGDSWVYFDVLNGVIGNLGGINRLGQGIISKPNGFYHCWTSGRWSGGSVARTCAFYMSDINGGANPVYVGDGTSGIILWNPQIGVGYGPDDSVFTTEVPRT